jgi:hypothetical protein
MNGIVRAAGAGPPAGPGPQPPKEAAPTAVVPHSSAVSRDYPAGVTLALNHGGSTRTGRTISPS